MSSPESPAFDVHQPMDRQAGRGAALPAVLAVAARALAEAPADADDTALLAMLGQAIVPVLGDVVALYVADSSASARLIGAAPGDAPPVRRLGEEFEHYQEIVVPLSGDTPEGELLVIRSTDPKRRYDETDRSAATVLAALLAARRSAIRQAALATTLRQQIEALRLAGRELAHALNNDLTMPVGIIELLMDQGTIPPELQDMLRAASKDLTALEQHVNDFHVLVRARTGSPKPRHGQGARPSRPHRPDRPG